jgi:uncharacterized protein YkwD
MFAGLCRVPVVAAVARSALLLLVLVSGVLLLPSGAGGAAGMAEETAAPNSASVPADQAAARGERTSGPPARSTIPPPTVNADSAPSIQVQPQLVPETPVVSQPQPQPQQPQPQQPQPQQPQPQQPQQPQPQQPQPQQPQPQLPPAGPVDDAGVEAQVLALVNDQRSAAGCGLLSADGALAGVARAHSADMRDRGFFNHTNPSGESPSDRVTAAGIGNYGGENIAFGYPTAQAVMQAWMKSPGHRANILNCALQTMGVGVAYGGASGPYWTQVFGR